MMSFVSRLVMLSAVSICMQFILSTWHVTPACYFLNLLFSSWELIFVRWNRVSRCDSIRTTDTAVDDLNHRFWQLVVVCLGTCCACFHIIYCGWELIKFVHEMAVWFVFFNYFVELSWVLFRLKTLQISHLFTFLILCYFYWWFRWYLLINLRILF